MVVAIAICLVAFVWFFLRLDPYLSDFMSQSPPTVTTVIGSPTASPSSTP
jgi:hypothetical protein